MPRPILVKVVSIEIANTPVEHASYLYEYSRNATKVAGTKEVKMSYAMFVRYVENFYMGNDNAKHLSYYREVLSSINEHYSDIEGAILIFQFR